MRKDRLTWGIIGHMTAWGFAGGAGAGFLYYVLLMALVRAVTGPYISVESWNGE